MKLAVLNVKGFRDYEKIRRVLRFLTEHQVDLALLCESHLDDEHQSRVAQRWCNHKWFSNSSSINSCGLTFVILIDRVNPETCEVYHKGAEDRSLRLRCEIEGSSSIDILGLYALNSKTVNCSFLQALVADPTIGSPSIILGDFNKVTNSMDRNPHREEDRRVRSVINDLTAHKGLIDGWRETYPTEKTYIYWSDNDMTSASRIDRIYAFSEVFRKCLKWHIIHTSRWTDHVMMTVKYYPRDRIKMSKRQWSLNENLLQNSKMRHRLVKRIDKHLTKMLSLVEQVLGANSRKKLVSIETAAAIVSRFNKLLKSVRRFAMKTQKTLILSQNKLEKRIMNRLNKLDSKRRNRRRAKKVLQLHVRLTRLKRFIDFRKTFATMTKWLNISERDADFWELSRAPKTQREVQGLTDEKGKVQKKGKKSVIVAKIFYKNLYNSVSTSFKVSERICKLLPKDDFFSMTGKVDRKEVIKVLRKWKYDKMSESSEISHDFYKKFSNKNSVSLDLTEVIRLIMSILIQSNVYGVLIPSNWIKNVIKVAYKKNDKSDIDNYRPLFMIEFVYKIFISIINNRLAGLVAKCLSRHQTTFMSKRFIYDNIKKAQTLLNLTKVEDKFLYLALLDQYKTYDQVDHEHLWRFLRAMSVSEFIIIVIQGCYFSAEFIVVVNKYSLRSFRILRDVRQGCSLFCLLYNCVIESLALLIINDSRLSRYAERNDTVHKVSMYVDDTCVFLISLSEWKILLRIYKLFARATDTSLNEKKCEILARTEALTTDDIDQTQMITQAVYLEALIDDSVDFRAFWKKLHQKIKRVINIWRRSHFSIRQRVAITKQGLQSFLWYFVRCLFILKSNIDLIQQTIMKFVWDNDDFQKLCGSIAIDQAIRFIIEDELSVINIKLMTKTLRIFWVNRMCEAHRGLSKEVSIWISLTVNLLTMNASNSIRDMIDMSWQQAWKSRSDKLSDSIDHFWSSWLKYRSSLLVIIKEKVSTVNFWFHSELLLDRSSSRWDASVWRFLLRGTNEADSVNTVEELWAVSREETRTSVSMRSAAKRLLRFLLEFWISLLDDDVSVLSSSSHIGIRCQQDNSLLSMNAFNREIYKHLLLDKVRSKNLLANFRALCRIDEVSLEDVTDKFIWLSVRHRSVDYSKFTDLYWRMILNCVRIDESWMNSRDCSMCGITQLTKHLFWDCFVASTIWETVLDHWESIIEEQLTKSTSWAIMLLIEVTHSRGAWRAKASRKRWRILFEVGFWALWIHRCAWSFQETDDFIATEVKGILLRLMRDRIQIDRKRVLDAQSRNAVEVFEEIWGYDSIEANDFFWLV